MNITALILRYLIFFCVGMVIGAIGCGIYELVKRWRMRTRKLKYSVLDYGSMELIAQKYKDRALEVYTLLDPDQRLMRGGYVGEFNYMPFVFKKGEKPELMVVLTFHDADDEDYSNENREAWFPFELMNSEYISSLNAEGSINVSWEKRDYIYGGGSCWKMVARFAEPIDDKFLNNLRR